MNVNNIVPIRKCTSCQMCAAVCAREAINIRLNEDGFYRPYVDDNKCTDCGLCTRFCYKLDENVIVTASDDLNQISVYYAQSQNNALLHRVTSGGVADALAKELIRQGYICVGVKYDVDTCRAEHVVASTAAETDAFRGSKYIQSYSFEAFKNLVGNISHQKYAVFGLPCHIYAINSFLSFRKLIDNCIFVDLFCHGCPSMHVWTKYEKEIKNRIGEERIDDVQFRSKVKGWGAFHVATEKNGKKTFVSTPHNDEFYSLFFSDHVLNDACADCMLRSTMAYTDIRLGDFWGKRFLNDKNGVSVVAITSERGKRLFDTIKSQFKVGQSSMNEVLVKQSFGKNYCIDSVLRREMLASLREDSKTLKETEELYFRSQGVTTRLKRIVKIIDWYMPFDLIRFLRHFA